MGLFHSGDARLSTTRRLAAILAADVAGYSCLMGADEVGTLEPLKACRYEIVILRLPLTTGVSSRQLAMECCWSL